MRIWRHLYELNGYRGLETITRYKSYSPELKIQAVQDYLSGGYSLEQIADKYKITSPKQLRNVTEFKYGNGKKAYLSAILDLHDKSIVAYVLGHSNNNSLVYQTLDMALQAAPGSMPMIHSDRGFQNTSCGFKKRLETHGLTQSMSRVGNCIDNCPMEGFWGTLKCEKYYLHKYHTFETLKNDIDSYIYFYNYERLQAKINSLSPMEFRTKAA